MDAYEAKEQRRVPRFAGAILPPLGPNMTEMQGAQAQEGLSIAPFPKPLDHDDFHYSDVEQLLGEREKTHGSFALNAHYGQTLRAIFRNSPGWELATPRTREVLDYYAGKLSRILSGQPNEAQHHEDIAGYARLAAHPDLQR